MKSVTVVYKEPGEGPEIREVIDTLEEYQNLVGGYIEHVRIKPGLGMIVNEEGKMHDMEPNFVFRGDKILGPAVFVGDAGEEFDSLTPGQIAAVVDGFKETPLLDM